LKIPFKEQKIVIGIGIKRNQFQPKLNFNFYIFTQIMSLHISAKKSIKQRKNNQNILNVKINFIRYFFFILPLKNNRRKYQKNKIETF